MNKIKFLDIICLIFGTFLIIIPFVNDYETDSKISIGLCGILLLSNCFIKKNIVRYTIAGICLCVFLYVKFKK